MNLKILRNNQSAYSNLILKLQSIVSKKKNEKSINNNPEMNV